MMEYMRKVGTSVGRQIAPLFANPADLALMAAQEAAERTRLAAITDAQHAVDGLWPDPLETAPGEPTDQVKVNLMGPVVDVSGYFLFGQPPTLELETDGEDTSAASPPETWLAECQRRNDWPAFLLDAAHNGGTGGTTYVRLEPAALMDGPHPYPTFYVMDPACMSIATAPGNIKDVTAYTHTYNTADRAIGRPANRRWTARKLPDGTWEQLEEENRAAVGAGWQPLGEPVPWPYPFPPVLHCKNLPNPNSVYGRPDISDNLIGLNRALNLNLSNRQLVEWLHGHPLKWVKGMMGQALPMAVNRVVDIPSPNGEIGQLAPAIDSQAGEGLATEIRAAIGEESATPGITLGRADDLGNPSGVALLVRLWPLQMKTHAKRALYEPFLVELCRRLFVLGNWGTDLLVEVTWPNLIPIDRLALVQALQGEQALGVTSKATMAAELGRDWDHEQANMDAEHAADPPPPPVVVMADPVPPPPDAPTAPMDRPPVPTA